jgi:hypothetical protein
MKVAQVKEVLNFWVQDCPGVHNGIGSHAAAGVRACSHASASGGGALVATVRVAHLWDGDGVPKRGWLHRTAKGNSGRAKRASGNSGGGA